MPFGLCNAPATFQRCMMSIFSDMVEKFIKVFMDDFSVFGTSFDDCLTNLVLVLKRCEETNLVSKLGEMSLHGIRRNCARPSNFYRRNWSRPSKDWDHWETSTSEYCKRCSSFLGHAKFYRRFIKDFSQVTKPLCNLLLKDTSFKFDE